VKSFTASQQRAKSEAENTIAVQVDIRDLPLRAMRLRS